MSPPAGMFEAVRSVSGERLKWVVVTRGREGADAYAASSEVHVDAVAADQIDATGAGDAFTVGLLHGLLQGDDMVTALQLGAAWGAATVAQLRSIPVPWEELAARSTSQATSGLQALSVTGFSFTRSVSILDRQRWPSQGLPCQRRSTLSAA